MAYDNYNAENDTLGPENVSWMRTKTFLILCYTIYICSFCSNTTLKFYKTKNARSHQSTIELEKKIFFCMSFIMFTRLFIFLINLLENDLFSLLY